MDLTTGQRRLVFAVVVIALAGLGIFLVKGHDSGSPAAAPSPSASASPSSGAASSAAGSQSVPPSSIPAATPVSTAGGAEIYQWLPFTPTEFSAAAQTTVTFAKDYATWSYTESAAAYTAKLSPLVAPSELAQITSGFSTAGVAQQRTADKQVSTGSGTIDSISSIVDAPGPASITFVVTINQQVTPAQPTGVSPSQQYAVTVVSSGAGWLVNDLELPNTGNQ
jgi:hypothetical protein